MIYANNFFNINFENDILNIKTTSENPSSDDINNLIIQLNNIYEAFNIKDQHFSFIIDVQNLTFVNPKYVMNIFNFFNEKKPYTVKLVKCSCFVTSNYTIKSILNGFFKLYTSVKPIKFVSNYNECYEFINSVQDGNYMNTNEL